MRKFFSLLPAVIGYCFLQAQNVGIGTTEPFNKLQVAGSILVNTPTTTTNTAPTAAQDKTMANATTITFSNSDSTGRVYDPGGASGNYSANILAYATIQGIGGTSHVGIEIIAESMNLGIGDSLIIKNSPSSTYSLLAVGNGYTATSKWIFNNTFLHITFKSNSDANVGSGFSLRFKKLYDNSASLPEVNGFAGNGLFFDAKTGSLRSGYIFSFTRGAFSTGLGYEATASGTGSSAIGYATTAIGEGAAALGYEALAAGNASTAMGAGTTANGNFSVAMGSGTSADADFSTATGHHSIAYGHTSTAMGFETIAASYRSTVLGSCNTASGLYDAEWVSTDPLFIIGNGISPASRSNALMILKNGNTGIGTNVPQTKLHIQNGTDANLTDNSGYLVLGDINNLNVVIDNNEILARNNGADASLTLQATGGAFVVGGSASKPGGGSWTASSDIRLKQNIQPYTDGLRQLLKINPVYFNYNQLSGCNTQQQYIGVLAQELKEVAPYMVGTFAKNDTEYLSVDNSAMMYMLINAVKEQQKEIEALKNQNTTLAAGLERLEALLLNK